MKKRIIINYKGKRLEVETEDCSLLKKFTGLMFSLREKAGILLFSFRRKQKIRIHSLFVFYPFVAVWLDERNKVVDMKKVKPFSFCISPKKSSFNLVEIPINNNYRRVVTFLDGN
jgi:uncharacterized membrane protein (UPF0127 family)